MNNDDASSIATCGCWIVLVIFNFLVGGWSVNYLLDIFANKMIPFFWAAVIGLFAGEVSVPVAVVVAILRWFHVL